MEVVEHLKYLGSLKSADGRHQIPNWNGLENNDRHSTDRERQSNEQRPANEISSLTRVYRMRDSTRADEKTIVSADLWIYRRVLRVSWTEHRTDQCISLQCLTPPDSF